jgi:hypothetical protein
MHASVSRYSICLSLLHLSLCMHRSLTSQLRGQRVCVCGWGTSVQASLSCQQQLRKRASERERERARARARERYLIEVVGLIDEQLNLLPPFQHLCHIFCACVCACECNVWALDRCSSGDIGERTDSVDTPSAYHQHPNANAHLSARYSTTQTILGGKKHGLLLCERGAAVVVAQQGEGSSSCCLRCCCARVALSLLSHSNSRLPSRIIYIYTHKHKWCVCWSAPHDIQR